MKKQTKKPNSFWLKNKHILCTALTTMSFLLGLNHGVVAQNNASYNANSVPIGGGYSSAFGFEALKSNRGDYNTANGYKTLSSNTTGSHNTANGTSALYSNTEGWNNTANGYQALSSNTTGSHNTANGTSALYSNTEGWGNTANGYQALYSNTTGSHNTALGSFANVSSGNLTYATAIGAKAKVTTSNAIQLGNDSVTKVFAGVGNTATLVTGGLQVTGSAPAAGKVLTSDAGGVATWQTPSSDWTLRGNAGATDSNFIGTIDNIPFNIRVNNKKAGRIDDKNTFYGLGAGKVNTTGWNNTANGANALSSNTTGYRNTAAGFYALYNNNTGSDNTANGSYAMQANTTGSNNIAVGGLALYSNTTGSYNTASGYNTLYYNTTGVQNTADGLNALYSNTIGSWNTASGSLALSSNISGNANTASGYRALYSSTTAYNNTASGADALYSNTTGNNNTANGYRALYSNTTGDSNTANGVHALYANTTGKYNTAIGYGANVSVGDLNNATAIGANAKVTASNTVQLGDNAVTKVYAGTATNTTLIAGTLQATSGAINTANSPVLTIEVNNQKAGRIDANNAFYGSEAGALNGSGGYGVAMGRQSLYNNTTGDGNIAIGYLALNANNTGSYNTAIGYNANTASGSLTNATAIGAGAVVNASNKIRLGDESITIIEGKVMFTTSDGRFKTNINEEEVKGLAFIKKLRPVVYNFDTKKFQSFLTQNMPADVRQKYMDKDFSVSTAIRQSGFIAQEVEKAAEEVGYDFNGIHKPESANDNYSLAYSQFVVPLVKGMQEQQQIIEQLQKEKEQQQKINEQLQQRMEALEKHIAGNSNLSHEPVTKITTNSAAEDLKLFPNPTTGVFTIMANNINNATIEVYDRLGNSVKKEMLANIKSGYQLDLSGYAKGTYWVNIISGNKKYTKQIVVQ